MKKKLTLVVSLLLVMALSIGGTLAYLTDTSETITNTFTVGNVTISLAETTGEEYKIIPGDTVKKDPTITVGDKSEDCYVYALIENGLTLTIDNETVVVATPDIDDTKWTLIAGDDVKGLYRYNEKCSAKATAKIFGEVEYDGEAITAENIESLSGDKIVVTAFAHQFANVEQADADTAAAAWAELTLNS